MIAHLRGVIMAQTIDRVILDVHGVGYEVFVPAGTQGRLGGKSATGEGEEVSVHVFTSVREDAIQLFGFASMDQKKVFEKLTGVSGVGPKLALAVLSTLEPEELVRAVETNDVVALTGVPGVGKKKAQRLILEMKSRFDDMTLDAIAPAGTEGGLLNDLKSALQNLGYQDKQIESVLAQLSSKVEDASTVEDLLREAFKLLR